MGSGKGEWGVEGEARGGGGGGGGGSVHVKNNFRDQPTLGY